MEATAVGIQYIDDRVEYITVLYGVSQDVLYEHFKTRDQVIGLIRMGSRDSLEVIEELELLPEECAAPEVVESSAEFFNLKDCRFYYLFTMDRSWHKVQLY